MSRCNELVLLVLSPEPQDTGWGGAGHRGADPHPGWLTAGKVEALSDTPRGSHTIQCPHSVRGAQPWCRPSYRQEVEAWGDRGRFSRDHSLQSARCWEARLCPGPLPASALLSLLLWVAEWAEAGS